MTIKEGPALKELTLKQIEEELARLEELLKWIPGEDIEDIYDRIWELDDEYGKREQEALSK